MASPREGNGGNYPLRLKKMVIGIPLRLNGRVPFQKYFYASTLFYRITVIRLQKFFIFSVKHISGKSKFNQSKGCTHKNIPGA